MTLDKLKDLLTIEESDTDVIIKLGWVTIACLEEEDGRWFPRMPGNKTISVWGFVSKELAFEYLLHYINKE